MKALGVGPVLIDKLYVVDHFPDEDTTLLAESSHERLGGPVPHRLAFHAAMGGESVMVGSLGDDSVADRVFEILERLNVSTVHLTREAGRESGVGSAWLSKMDSTRTIVYTNGTTDPLDKEVVTPSMLEGVSIVHTDSRQVTLAAALNAMTLAKEREILVSHDTASPKPYSEELIRLADIVQSPLMFARRALHIDDLIDAAQWLKAFGPRVAVVSDGARGAAYCTTNETGIVPAFDVKPVTTIGAGDRFGGALSHALLKDVPVHESVQFACAAAAMRTLDIDPPIPSESEIWDFVGSTPTLPR